MKNGMILLLLFASFGLNAKCYRYDYELMTFPKKENPYKSTIFYCVNDMDGTLSLTTNWDADYREENTLLNENNKQFSCTSRTEYSEDKKTATIFLDWTSSQRQLDATCTYDGTVTFKVDGRGAYVYRSDYAKKDTLPENGHGHWNVRWFERKY